MSNPGRREHILFANKGTCSMGPEMVLEEVGLPYQLVPINSRANQTRTRDYLKINPAGQVPCMVLPDRRKLTESAAIMLTFRNYRSDHPFAASWCDERMPEVLRWLFFLSGSMTRGYSLSGRPDKFVGGEQCQSDLAQKGREHIEGLWSVVESSIEGESFFREGYSVVDTYIVMQLCWDQQRQSLLASRPKLQLLYDIVTSRSAIGRIIQRHSNDAFWQYDAIDLPDLVSELTTENA